MEVAAVEERHDGKIPPTEAITLNASPVEGLTTKEVPVPMELALRLQTKLGFVPKPVPVDESVKLPPPHTVDALAKSWTVGVLVGVTV